MTIFHDVIIPARGEWSNTLIPTIDAFLRTNHIRNIILVDDGLAPEVVQVITRHPWKEYDRVYITEGPQLGKGQAVMAGLAHSRAKRVIFCDGDLTGFTPDHAARLVTSARDLMILGIPDHSPGHPPWPVNTHIRTLVTGQRSIPRWLLMGVNLYGYCMEVQINHAAMRASIHTKLVDLGGCKSASRWTPQRIAEMERDRVWLDAHPFT